MDIIRFSSTSGRHETSDMFKPHDVVQQLCKPGEPLWHYLLARKALHSSALHAGHFPGGTYSQATQLRFNTSAVHQKLRENQAPDHKFAKRRSARPKAAQVVPSQPRKGPKGLNDARSGRSGVPSMSVSGCDLDVIFFGSCSIRRKHDKRRS